MCIVKNRVVTGCLLLAMSIGLTGCGGPKPPPTAIVSGSITLDGAPLEEGSITFVPSDGNGATAGAPIVGGNYSATVPLGPKRVEIRAPKVVGSRKTYDTPDSPTIDIIEELIPAEYNNDSKLTTTVTVSKSDGNFELKSAAK